MNWTRFELTIFGSGSPLTPNRLKELEDVLGCRAVYCEENPKELFVVVREADVTTAKQVANVKEYSGKSLRIVGEEDLTGLLVGLFDDRRRFLGMGVVNRIDYENRVLKVNTPCKERIDIVQFGQVRLDKLGREVGYTAALSDQMPK